jgi:alkylation response protein AidB-like acyl-CoA dehydrogenase
MQGNIYDADHDAFRSSVRGFVDKVLRPRHDEMLETRTVPRDIWKQAGIQGLLGLSIPEQFGGAGAEDFRFNAILAEEIAAFSLGVSACVSIHSDVCVPYLTELGTPAQKKRWLPGIAAGEQVCSIAMTEPSGGSDLAALKSAARRDGDDWIINGAKTFITNGRSPHRRRQRRQRYLVVRHRGRNARVHPRPQARQGGPGRGRHRRTVLRRRAPL